MNKYFIDDIHVMTDYMGGWCDQWVTVGWYDSNSNHYFNLDEVKEIYNKGEADNVDISDDGTLYMKSRWLDARTAFSIICGIPFKVANNHQNLLDYCVNHDLITPNPIPIKMYSGTKYLDILGNGNYRIRYQLDSSQFDSPVHTFIEKMCVGRIKRLKAQNYESHHDGVKEIKYVFHCGEVSYNPDTFTLVIDEIPYDDVYSESLIDSIRNLDLEFLISNSSKVNFSNVLSACKDWCRDHGQYHWIGESRYKDESKSTVYWFDK